VTTTARPGRAREAPPPSAEPATDPVEKPARSSRSVAAVVRRLAVDTRPLRHPAYRRMFIGQAVSSMGLAFTAVAVPMQMYALAQSSLWVGLLGVASLVPLVVFALWGGALADTLDRRVLLLGASALMWSSTLLLLVTAALDATAPWLLLALTALQSTGMGASSASRGAIIPRLVPEAELPAANALSSTAMTLSMTVGPLLAGLLVGDGHYALAYAFDAAAFTVALWAAFRLPALLPGVGTPSGRRARSRPGTVRAKAKRRRVPAGARRGHATTRPVRSSPPRGTTGWREVGAGLSYIASQPVLWLSFAIDIAAMVLALPRALFPEVADQRFGLGAIGWLFAAISIGSMLAGLTSGWIGRVRRQGVALVAAVVVWGLAVAAAGVAPYLWLAVALLALGGAADMVSAIYRQTILQTYAPDEMRGRLQGVFFSVVAGGPRLGDLRAGGMAAVVGPTVSWVGGGIAAAVVAMVLAAAFPALLRYPSESVKR
jgi:MFS family permease